MLRPTSNASCKMINHADRVKLILLELPYFTTGHSGFYLKIHQVKRNDPLFQFSCNYGRIDSC